MRSFLIAIVAALLAAAPCAAQSTELRPGVRVRISAPGVVASQLTGTILSRTADTLVIGSPDVSPLPVAVSRIGTLEISRGKSRADGAIAGLKWGVPIGLGLGALFAVIINDCQGCNVSEVGVVTLYGLSGAFYGAGIGALIGKERWVPFDIGARVGLRPVVTSRGVALAASF